MRKVDLDPTTREAIERLVKEETRLHEQNTLADADWQRLRAIHVELDAYWELLRRGRAVRETREHPGAIRLRPKVKEPLREV